MLPLPALLLPLLATLAASCGPDRPSAGPEAGVTASDVVSDPQRYVGRPVTVSGRIVEIRSPGMFTIGTGGPLEPLLLVVSSSPGRDEPSFDEGDVVRVSGTVRVFRWADYEEEFGPFVGPGIAESFYDSWENQPALIANRITRLPGGRAGGV